MRIRAAFLLTPATGLFTALVVMAVASVASAGQVCFQDAGGPRACYDDRGGGNDRDRDRGEREHSGPTPEQLRQQRIEREFQDLVRQAQSAGTIDQQMDLVRRALALREDASLRAWLTTKEAAINGDAAYAAGDKVRALAYYRQAAAHPEYASPKLGQFISDLEKDIAFDRQFSGIRTDARALKETVRQQQNALAPTVGGLDFVSDLTATGAFGTRIAKPKLVPVAPAAGPGTDKKAGDQLLSAAEATRNGEELTPNFDGGTAKAAGSLDYGRPHAVDLSGFSERARQDPLIVATVKELDALQTQRQQLELQRDELVRQRNATKEPAEMNKLTEQVTQKEKDYQSKLAVIAEKEQVVKRRHLEIDTQVEAPK